MWNERYSGEDFVYGVEPNDFLFQKYGRIKKDGRVLCLAEGEGRNAVFLAKMGFEVTAVDQAAVGLEKAQKLARENGVEINTVAADLATYDLGQAEWDGIVSVFAHVPAEVRKAIHGNFHGALKAEGVLILEAFTLRQLEMDGEGGPPASNRDFFMSLDGLKNEIRPLKVIHGAECDRELHEGDFHHGRCAVVQLLGMKG